VPQGLEPSLSYVADAEEEGLVRFRLISCYVTHYQYDKQIFHIDYNFMLKKFITLQQYGTNGSNRN